MSKRGTSEEHVSREQYHYDHGGDADGDDATLFGQFRQASSDEIAKRVIKQPRSRLSKMNSASSDDGTNRPNPFVKPAPSPMATSSFTASSMAASASTPAKSNPFAGFAFPTASATSAPSTTTTSAPTNLTATPPSKFSFTPAAFSSSQPKAPSPNTSASSITVKPMGSSREEYERSLEALNTTFVRKITKEIEKNPIANLAQVFGQYVDQRTKVKARFNEGSGGIASKVAKKDPLSATDNDKPAFIGSSNGSLSTSSSAPSSAPSTTLFSFSVPASKESDAAPKPAFSGFNFGVKSDSSLVISTAPSTTTTSTTPAPLFGSFGGFGAKTGATAGSSSFSFGAPASSVTPAAASSGASPAPFSFSASKPLSFNTNASAPSTALAADSSAPAAPKPFAFQVPAQFTAPSTPGTDEDDKMPDDTQSNLVDNREGEEGESTVYEVRAKLYAFEGSEHKDLGVGQFRVNEVEATKKRRMIMRNSTGMLTLNSWVIQGMSAKRDKTTLTVFAIADGKPKRYAVRVKTEDSAKELEAALAAGQLGDDNKAEAGQKKAEESESK